MRFAFIVVLALCLAACSTPAADMSSPGAGIMALQEKFEARVLAVEGEHRDDPDGLSHAALAIALEVYGDHWDVVRAETQRSLAALPEINLTTYESAPESTTATPKDEIARMLGSQQELLTPAGLAMARMWDARVVGGFCGPMFAPPNSDGDPVAMIGAKLSLVPPRTWRGKFKGEDVLASRYLRSMIVIPYQITGEGMILPTFDKVSVYAYQAPKA